VSIENTAPERLYPINSANLDQTLEWLDDEENVGAELAEIEATDPDLFGRLLYDSILIATDGEEQEVVLIDGEEHEGNPEVGGAFLAGAAAGHAILRTATKRGPLTLPLAMVPMARDRLEEEGETYANFHGLMDEVEPKPGSGAAVLSALYLPHLQKEPDFEHCLTDLSRQHEDPGPQVAYLLGGAAVVTCARLSYLMKSYI